MKGKENESQTGTFIKEEKMINLGVEEEKRRKTRREKFKKSRTQNFIKRRREDEHIWKETQEDVMAGEDKEQKEE